MTQNSILGMHTLCACIVRIANIRYLAFAGLVTGVAVWSIWGGDMFPQTPDPKGDPETWSMEELRRWLAAVGLKESLGCSKASLTWCPTA